MLKVHTSCGISDDQAHRNGNVFRRPVLPDPADPLEQHLRADFSHFRAGLRQRRERRVEHAGQFPVVKPDNGVGANDTHRLCSDDDLIQFFATKLPVRYIMEEYIDATVNSYDAIVNSKGEPIFETGNVTPFSIMDIVNNNDNSIYYIVNELAADVRDAGRRTILSS